MSKINVLLPHILNHSFTIVHSILTQNYTEKTTHQSLMNIKNCQHFVFCEPWHFLNLFCLPSHSTNNFWSQFSPLHHKFRVQISYNFIMISLVSKNFLEELLMFNQKNWPTANMEHDLVKNHVVQLSWDDCVILYSCFNKWVFHLNPKKLTFNDIYDFTNLSCMVKVCCTHMICDF